jgi:DNA-binding transcriptional MerR regulator
MENEIYTISELERLTGLGRRTIHFYTKEGLIPPPEGAGGGARYGEEHLLRLKLIGEFQKSRLRLDEIRDALNIMSIEEMRSRVDRAEANIHQVRDKEDLSRWLSAGDLVTETFSSLNSQVLSMDSGDVEPISFLKIGRERQSKQKQSPVGRIQNVRASQSVREESWQRYKVAEGLEVNVRSDIVRRHRQMIMKLLEELSRNIREEG